MPREGGVPPPCGLEYPPNTGVPKLSDELQYTPEADVPKSPRVDALDEYDRMTSAIVDAHGKKKADEKEQKKVEASKKRAEDRARKLEAKKAAAALAAAAVPTPAAPATAKAGKADAGKKGAAAAPAKASAPKAAAAKAPPAKAPPRVPAKKPAGKVVSAKTGNRPLTSADIPSFLKREDAECRKKRNSQCLVAGRVRREGRESGLEEGGAKDLACVAYSDAGDRYEEWGV